MYKVLSCEKYIKKYFYVYFKGSSQNKIKIFLKKHQRPIDVEFHQLSNELLGSSQLWDLPLVSSSQSDHGVALDHLKNIETDCDAASLTQRP